MEHVVYASAMNGFARLDPNDGNMDMYPLLDMIIDDMPAPEVDETAPLAMQCVTIDHSNFVGRIGIGRVYSGTIHQATRFWLSRTTAPAPPLPSSSSLPSTTWAAPSARKSALAISPLSWVLTAPISAMSTRPREPRRARAH